MQKIAVILFPGTNCENESAYAAESAGMQAEIVRWNSKKPLSDYGGFILPGGFSYEDRIRAGVIAANLPVMQEIKAEAEKGKPILGICNGAQILIETGIVPGLHKRIDMALAPNINQFISGYYCTWVYIKSIGSSLFNSLYKEGELIQIPIAHGEGRFVTRDIFLLEELKKNNQIAFQYCDKNGKEIEEFPVNPNGAMYNIAAISNPKGNVLAIMPHPERASFRRQLVEKGYSSFEEAESLTNAIKIFQGMKKYIDDGH